MAAPVPSSMYALRMEIDGGWHYISMRSMLLCTGTFSLAFVSSIKDNNLFVP
jgi:hypothetical protein